MTQVRSMTQLPNTELRSYLITEVIQERVHAEPAAVVFAIFEWDKQDLKCLKTYQCEAK